MCQDKQCPTAQELIVLRALVVYGTVAAAASRLYLSPHTVDAHVDHLRAKSGHRRLHQIVAWAADHGWFANGPVDRSRSNADAEPPPAAAVSHKVQHTYNEDHARRVK